MRPFKGAFHPGDSFAFVNPRGTGVEAHKIRCELLRAECTAYQNYNRDNHFSAIHLRSIIGKNFNKTDLMSMATDIGGWTGVRCPRNWVRLEALMLCYLMQNRLILIDKWKEGQFTIQQPVRQSAEPTESSDTFAQGSEEDLEAETSNPTLVHEGCPGRIWWGD
jgi:hypothetical protein